MPKRNSTLPPELLEILAHAEGPALQYANNPDPLPVSEPEDEEPALELSPEEILGECALEPETDIGNARRFLNRYGERVRHITNVGWHGYDGKRWLEDVSGSITRAFAHRTAEFIDEEAIRLDCDAKEQAAIEAGKLALARMKEMGRPPSATIGIDDGRAAELDVLIEVADTAKMTMRRLGRPKVDWDDELHAKYLALENDLKVGRAAEREKRKMLDATSSWTVDQYEEWGKLEEEIAAMRAVQDSRSGRMSSRHNHAKSSAGSSKINNMMNEAIPYVSMDVNELNRDLLALNVGNGTLRFWRENVGEKAVWRVRLDPHRSRDFMSKLAAVAFEGDAFSHTFDVFLKRIIPDPDIRAFLQRYMGYCLLGLTGEQCLVFFYGIGRNGKSTFVDLMVEILADYAVAMSIDSFAGDSKRAGAEATPDLARLPGARLVAASEPEMGVRLKDALIKTLTGDDKIPVRRLHQDFFELIPQFKIILSGNHKPIIHDDSDGIWRRVHLVPFDIQIPEEEVDPYLPKKLRAERAGVFAWMVRGALDYLERGLMVPASVKAATAEYREESDPIGAFVRNGCIVTGSDSDRASPEDLFIGYMNYAKREGLSEFKSSTFTKRFPDQTRKSWMGADRQMKQFRKGKSGTTVYYGIRVREEFTGKTERPQDLPVYSRDDDPFPPEFQ